MSYARQHLDESARILAALDADAIERIAALLASLRADGGRLFFLGVGGSAANCSHAVNDFRKIAGIEA
jgi:D-sedoheptulose 7-phosphate isomerase